MTSPARGRSLPRYLVLLNELLLSTLPYNEKYTIELIRFMRLYTLTFRAIYLFSRSICTYVSLAPDPTGVKPYGFTPLRAMGLYRAIYAGGMCLFGFYAFYATQLK